MQPHPPWWAGPADGTPERHLASGSGGVFGSGCGDLRLPGCCVRGCQSGVPTGAAEQHVYSRRLRCRCSPPGQLLLPGGTKDTQTCPHQSGPVLQGCVGICGTAGGGGVAAISVRAPSKKQISPRLIIPGAPCPATAPPSLWAGPGRAGPGPLSCTPLSPLWSSFSYCYLPFV